MFYMKIELFRQPFSYRVQSINIQPKLRQRFYLKNSQRYSGRFPLSPLSTIVAAKPFSILSVNFPTAKLP